MFGRPGLGGATKGEHELADVARFRCRGTA